MTEAVLGIAVNGRAMSDGEVVLLRDGQALVPEQLLRRLNLSSPGPAVSHGGDVFLPLPVPARVDAGAQLLVIEAPASAFARTAYGAASRLVPPPPSAPGAFFDYDVLAERGTGMRTDGALMRAGLFGRFGLATHAARLIHSPSETRTIRLETSWALDDPVGMERLRIGDAVSASGSWGRPVRFGGVRWGRAFDTAPGYLTAPTLALAGETSLPSEVEVYVNDALQRQIQVPAGPFAIEDVPMVTGGGTLRMVVRDLLGREQVVEAPYYAGLGLLRPGLDDWSVEAGRVRRRWGLYSDDYGDSFAAATWRHGFTPWFTGEARLEGRAARQTVGFGTALATEPGTLSASVAASRSPEGPGVLGGLGWSYVGRGLSFGLSAEQASPDFSQLGLEDPRPLRRRTQLVASTALPAEAGSLSLSLARMDYWRQQNDAGVASLTHAVGIGGMATLVTSGTLTTSDHQRDDVTIGITLVVPLGGAGTVAAGQVHSRSGGARSHAQYDRAPVEDVDWGLRAMRSSGSSERAAVGGSVNAGIVAMGLDVGRADGAESARLQAQGSLVLMGGGLYAGRALGDSFAVVDTGHAGVGISHDNRRVATTGRDGRALVAGLRPYEDNRIGIDPADLPADVEVAADHQTVIPWRGAGTVVGFSLPAPRRAVARLKRPDGSPVPVGARAALAGQPMPLPIGYDGEVLLPALAEAVALDVWWPGGRCRATVSVQADAAAVALPCVPP